MVLWLLLLVAGLLHEIALTADHPQLVLVGGGQVDRSRGDRRPEVSWVWDLQVGSCWSSGENCKKKLFQYLFLASPYIHTKQAVQRNEKRTTYPREARA